MRRSARATSVLGAVVVLAALVPAPSGRAAQEGEFCPGGANPDGPAFGPICAELKPPVTVYHVMDNPHDEDDDFFSHYDVYWSDTSVSCGKFTPNSGYPGEGNTGFSPPQVRWDEYATWSHKNAPDPDNCSHDAPSHPGTIVAEAIDIIALGPLQFGSRVTYCTYSGSNTGVGRVCSGTPPKPGPSVKVNGANAAVRTEGEKLEVAGSGSDVRIVFPESDFTPVVIPQDTLKNLTILGVPGADDVNVSMEGLDTFIADGGKIGLNGVGGTDEFFVDLHVFDLFDLGSLPATEQVPSGGVGLDVNNDGTFDIGTININHLVVDGGTGDDRLRLASDLYQQFLNREPAQGPLVDFLGGLGNDTLTFEGQAGADNVSISGFNAGGDAGLTFDVTGAAPADITSRAEIAQLLLGEGNDTGQINVDEFYRQYLNRPSEVPPLEVDGGPGSDKFKIQDNSSPRPSDRAYFTYNYFGTSPSGPRAAQSETRAQVNLNGADDDVVDLVASAIERWAAVGTKANDLFSGAGGHGTGDPFTFPLVLSGLGGDDNLIGGDKADTLNGGAGSKDVCTGGKGKDSALGCEKVKSIP